MMPFKSLSDLLNLFGICCLKPGAQRYESAYCEACLEHGRPGVTNIEPAYKLMLGSVERLTERYKNDRPGFWDALDAKL